MVENRGGLLCIEPRITIYPQIEKFSFVKDDGIRLVFPKSPNSSSFLLGRLEIDD